MLALIERVLAVLTEYAAHLPLTCRQIFYRLVGARGEGFEKRPMSAWPRPSAKHGVPIAVFRV